MTEKIINLIPSEDLKKKIKETNHTFRENELLQIIENYAEPRELRLDMMLRFSEIAGEEISALAKEYVRYEEAAFAAFVSNNSGAVYELKIRETPDSYEECYLCDSYNSALLTIDKFYRRYDFAKENEATVYEIAKRFVLSEEDVFDEDKLAECTLGPRKAVMRLWSEEVSTGGCKVDNLCSECDQICRHRCDEVKYPNIAENFALVKYKGNKGEDCFAVNLDLPNMDNRFLGELYAIALDSPSIVAHNFSDDTIFGAHTHLALPTVSLASLDDLTERQRATYLALVEYLKKNPHFA